MLRDKFNSAMKEAMRSKDRRRLSTIRLIMAAVKDRDISVRTESDSKVGDSEIIDILSKMVKQRNDSIKAYQDAGRLELAKQEADEIDIIQEFLPRQLDEQEIEVAVKNAIEKTSASGLKDIGKIMASLKGDYTGQMDFAKASAMAKGLLS
ncbi:MAG TPA: GatB/YqeY domain-containing protein [Emcibacteraceae bacterium]|nr:GatB/YqeY domain-containing protein [Emcibacteraceae bacterium]HRW29227.1 GatB/YqeY domain-containing protein [Emcibacteraceae bacterium]